MKITATQLRKIIKEEVENLTKSVDKDNNERFLHGSEHGEPHDDEGYMAKSQLASMKEMAWEVCELLDSDDQLPGWVQNHLAVAHENLRQVHGYLRGDEVLRKYE